MLNRVVICAIPIALAVGVELSKADDGSSSVTICDVIKQCSRWQGKNVVLQGVYATSLHSRSVYDLNCGIKYGRGKQETVLPVVEINSVINDSASDRGAMAEIDEFAKLHQAELNTGRIRLRLEGRVDCKRTLRFRRDENGQLAADGFGPRGLWSARLNLRRTIAIDVGPDPGANR